MHRRLTRLTIEMVVSGMVAGASAGGAGAQSSIEQVLPVPSEALINRDIPPYSETDFRLGDHQQLRGYFIGGSRDRFGR